MQDKVRLYVLFALIIALIFIYFKLDSYKSLSDELLQKNTQLKEENNLLKVAKNAQNYGKLIKQIESLAKENTKLKDQIYQLEKQKVFFEQNDQRYNLEDNLKFKDDTKDIKSLDSVDEKPSNIKINPSIDFNQDKKEIDRVQVEVETKF